MKTTPFSDAEIKRIKTDLPLLTGPSAGYFQEFRTRMIAALEAKDAEMQKLIGRGI